MGRILIICGLTSIMFIGSVNAADTKTEDVSTTFTNASTSTDEADSNGDLQGGSTGHAYGSGKQGEFQSISSSDLYPWDGSSICEFDESGFPIAGLQHYAAWSSVANFGPEDQLIQVLDDSQPSTLCVNSRDQTFTFEIHTVYIGGTGRFEGATGSNTITGSGRSVNPVLSASSGTSTGTITIPK